MRSTLLVLHILAAGTWIGGNVTQLVVTPWARKMGGGFAANWMRATVRMGRLLYTPAAIVALLTGIWLVIDSSVYDFEHAFVVIGVATVVIGGALGGTIFGPQGERAAELHEAGGDAGELAAVHSRLWRFGLLDSALLVLTVVAMVNRWGA